MGVKFPPLFLDDVEKGLFGAFSRLYAVDALHVQLTRYGREWRLGLRISHG